MEPQLFLGARLIDGVMTIGQAACSPNIALTIGIGDEPSLIFTPETALALAKHLVSLVADHVAAPPRAVIVADPEADWFTRAKGTLS